ncbi:MAG: hypothetical protein HPY45_08860 [Anaerolineae bacterium]|nr:hypothetical protein [Anaerolineae bacterium]
MSNEIPPSSSEETFVASPNIPPALEAMPEPENKSKKKTWLIVLIVVLVLCCCLVVVAAIVVWVASQGGGEFNWEFDLSWLLPTLA